MFFDVVEIHATLMSMNSNKAPGDNDFSTAYFKDTWHIFMIDIKKMLDYNSGSLPKGVISFFIALIPNIDNPTSVSDFV